MSDLATCPISEVIEHLRKPHDNPDDPMRSMIATLIFSTLATRFEEQEAKVAELEAALDDVWEYANHGQTQCSECQKTFLRLGERE